MPLHVQSWWRRAVGYQPYVVLVLVFAAIALGVHGFRSLPPPDGPLSWDNAFYSTLALSVLDWQLDGSVRVPLSLNIARFLAPAITGYAVIRSAMLLLTGVLERMRRRRLRRPRIVCGLGRRGRFLAVNRAAEGQGVVGIDSDPNPEIVTTCANSGISLVRGNAADSAVLMEAGILRAAEVFIFTSDDNLNLEIVHAIRRIRVEAGKQDKLPPLECYLSVKDLYLTELIPVHADFLEESAHMEVNPFNDHQSVARNLWQTMLKRAVHDRQCVPLLPEDPNCAHVVMLGFSPVGQAVAFQLAYQAHFANGTKTRLTIVDERLGEPAQPEADTVLSASLDRLSDLLDLRLHQAKPGNLATGQIILDAAAETTSLTTVVICPTQDSENLRLGLHANQELRQAGYKNVPVFVRLTDSTGLHEFLAREMRADEVLVNVHGFGLFRETFTPESICPTRLNRLARAIHASFLEGGHQPSDPAARDSWNRLPEYLKEANRKSAEHVELKCLSMGCDVSAGETPTEEMLAQHLDTLACMEHNRWMAEKILQGWRPGPVTDNKALTHKDLVPWDQLEESEKQKDWSQIRNIPRLLQAINVSD